MSDRSKKPIVRRRRVDVFRAMAVMAIIIVLAYIALLVVTSGSLLASDTLQELASSERTLSAVLLSVATALGAAAIAMVIGVPAAYALSRLRMPGRVVFDTLIDVPIALSPIALGILLLAMFSTGPGQALEQNVTVFTYAVPGILLAQLTAVCALTIRLLKTAFDEVPARLEAVARTLGSTRWRAFRRVTLPMARRSVFTAFVISFARAFGEFGATLTVAGATPGLRETLPVSIFLRFSSLQVSSVAGLILIAMAVAFVLILVLRVAASPDLRREIV